MQQGKKKIKRKHDKLNNNEIKGTVTWTVFTFFDASRVSTFLEAPFLNLSLSSVTTASCKTNNIYFKAHNQNNGNKMITYFR